MLVLRGKLGGDDLVCVLIGVLAERLLSAQVEWPIDDAGAITAGDVLETRAVGRNVNSVDLNSCRIDQRRYTFDPLVDLRSPVAGSPSAGRRRNR